MNYLNGNDNKSIKSALNDIKRNGVKITIERSIFWRDKLHLKNGTTNDKIRVNECENDKKRKIVLSFVIILCFLCGKNCRFLSFFRPHSVPRRKICPSKFNSKNLIINALQNPPVTFCVGKWAVLFAYNKNEWESTIMYFSLTSPIIHAKSVLFVFLSQHVQRNMKIDRCAYKGGQSKSENC